MGSPREVSVPDHDWKYLGTLLVSIPGSLVEHAELLAGSEHFDLVFSEDAYVIRGRDTGYGGNFFNVVWCGCGFMEYYVQCIQEGCFRFEDSRERTEIALG